MKDKPDIPEVSEVSLLSIVWLIKVEPSLTLKMCLGYSMEASGALPALLQKRLFFHLFQAKCQDEVKAYWLCSQCLQMSTNSAFRNCVCVEGVELKKQKPTLWRLLLAHPFHCLTLCSLRTEWDTGYGVLLALGWFQPPCHRENSGISWGNQSVHITPGKMTGSEECSSFFWESQ